MGTRDCHLVDQGAGCGYLDGVGDCLRLADYQRCNRPRDRVGRSVVDSVSLAVQGDVCEVGG